MKKIFLLLLLFVVPNFVLGATEAFTTKINVTVDAMNKVTVVGEEGASLEMSTNSSGTNTMTVILYRETAFEDDLKNLTRCYNNLTTLYNQCIYSVDKLNDTLDENRSNYYEKYTGCYFHMLDLNTSLGNCNDEKQELDNESKTCQNRYTDLQTQSNNYRNQYDSCSKKLGDYKGSGICADDLGSAKGNWVWGVLITAIIAAVGFYFYQQKHKPTGKHPTEGTEEMEL